MSRDNPAALDRKERDLNFQDRVDKIMERITVGNSYQMRKFAEEMVRLQDRVTVLEAKTKGMGWEL